jgi:hypothetical protein
MLREVVAGGRLMAALARAALSLRRSRGVAMASFRGALTEMGLPEAAAAELAEAYPKLDLKGLFEGRTGKEGDRRGGAPDLSP